eukprot:scaffold23813_cov174-Isochrysis_galbana.AAC.1
MRQRLLWALTPVGHSGTHPRGISGPVAPCPALSRVGQFPRTPCACEAPVSRPSMDGSRQVIAGSPNWE